MRIPRLLAPCLVLALALAGSGFVVAQDGEEVAPGAPVVEVADSPDAWWHRWWPNRHRSPGGGWSRDGFHGSCPEVDHERRGSTQVDAGSTALMLLVFTSEKAHFRSQRIWIDIEKEVRALLSMQQQDGLFSERGGPRFVRDHALSTLAIGNHAAVTLNVRFRDDAARGVRALLKERNRDGGWRTGATEGGSDAVATYWSVCALHVARGIGIKVEEGIFRDAIRWLDGVTEASTGIVLEPGREPVALCHAEDHTRTERATAAGLALRLTCGESREPGTVVARGVKYLKENAPRRPIADSFFDPEYWYLAVSSAYWMEGDFWKIWSESMKPALVDTQLRERTESAELLACEFGSWDLRAGHSETLGQVGTNALLHLCLSTYYRYSRCFCHLDRYLTKLGKAPQTLLKPSLDARVAVSRRFASFLQKTGGR